nr:hypothetical protein [Tanacetum cinerariifolium]
MLGIKCTRHSHCQVKSSHWQYKFSVPVKVVATARRLKMPLPEVCTAIEEKKKKLRSSHWQYKFLLPVKVVPTARRLEMPLPEVCTVIEEMMKKLAVKFSTSGIRAWRETLILREFPLNHTPHSLSNSQKEMDHQYPTVAKIPILDTGKFEQWQFRIQQYLQHEHYALWEVIEFDDSYKVPTNTNPDDASKRKDDEQSGRTVTITTKDMQRKKNDVKARTTLLLSRPDEHQLRFSKYKTAKELWAAILKTFGGNEATKKRKNNLLKRQYVEVEKDDLNQKFLTSLAPEWLMHTIISRNRNDLDTMSLDDLYNHLKVYEAEVQKKSNSNSQDMAFISSSNNSSNEDGNTSNGSQIKFEDINQIDEDDMEEMDIKWNMALLNMRAYKAPRSQERGRKESYRQGSKAEEKSSKALMAIDGVGWDWSYMANEEDHALVTDGEAPTEFALMANTESK